MKHWMQKVFVAFIAVLTLGLYIPQPPIELEQNEHKDEMDSKTGVANKIDKETLPGDKAIVTPVLKPTSTAVFEELDTATMLKQEAKEQATLKFGPKIAERVDLDFNKDILPRIETTLDSLLLEAGEHNAQHYSITEQPTSGLGEMIFNVYDERNQADIALFHVRRDNRPQEGYWFNFHYHLDKDHFQTHYTIGDIYWDKNTPPHWMA